MVNIRPLENWPERLLEIPDKPKKMYIAGDFPEGEVKYLAVVGSRKHSNYGRVACERIIEGLRGYPVVIISGLALGIDSLAHEAALRAGLKTIAVPGSGLSEKAIYPKSNFILANKILKAGGCLLSEFEPDFQATNWSFPMRNRIMAALSDAVLLIEAQEKSGTLITARLAMDYNRDVLVVPGEIFSETSTGTNMLLKDGAHPCLGTKEVLEFLGFKEQKQVDKNYDDCTDVEKELLKLLYEPISKEELMQKYEGSATELNTALSLLELKGHIEETLGEIRKI